MAKEGSVAPKERVNIVYKSDTGDGKEEVELPLKQLVIGDFTLSDSDTPVEDREPINVDKDNFNDVLKEQHLALNLAVPDRLSEPAEGEDEDRSLSLDLHFSSLSDFEPDAIAEQVPALKQLLELRESLKALKGPLGNVPEFRKRLQELMKNEEGRKRLLGELGVEESKEEGE